MKSPIWMRFAWREVRSARSFTTSFVLNLSLGLLGFLVLDAFKVSISNHLDLRSKAVLAADLRVSGRRAIQQDELARIQAALPPSTEQRLETGMVTMGRTPTSSRLIEIRAIDNSFPFYGYLELENRPDRIESGSSIPLNDEPLAWIYPELKVQLGVDVGDNITIGEQTFRIADIITNDPSLSSVAFTVAPKVFIGQSFMDDTGLIQLGSRVYHSVLYKVPPGVDPELATAQVKETLQDITDLQVRSHQSASEQMARVLIYLNDYLGLVALVALFLAAVGAAYLFRSFLGSRVGDIAILLSVGMKRRHVQMIYIGQLAILGAIATAVTLVITGLVLPILPTVFGDLWLPGLAVQMRPVSIALTAAVGIISSVLYCLPMLNRLGRLNPSALFREDASPRITLDRRAAFGWVPAIVFFWVLAMWQSKSYLTGSLFIVLFLGSGLILGAACYGSLRLVRRVIPRHRFALRMALLQLSRREIPTLACFMAVALGALLVNLIPQIRGVLEAELATSEGERPSLFMFDIQDEQVSPLREIAAQQGAGINYLSPMIRARYFSLNGEAVTAADAEASATREEERSARMQNRTFNLSYREELSSSEAIVAGEPYSTIYSGEGPAEISVETRFADRLGLKLGDIMGFDVQGVTVYGKIVNFRSVKWTSFQPNFFIQFQPGILEDAPKSFVAAIPGTSFDNKLKIQTAVVEALPNISVVDVSNAIERVMGIVGQVVRAIRFMAILTLLAGLAVLFSIARHQARSRQMDLNMLKILGSRFGTIRMAVTYEFLLIGLAAAVFGAGLSLVSASTVANVVFATNYAPDLTIPLASLVIIPAICIALGRFATSRQLAEPALKILRGNADQ